MRTEILCRVTKTAMQKMPPGDGLIRYWLSLQGWRVGHVQNGVIYLPSQVHADYITEMLASRWFPEAPMPLVGVYSPKEK